MTHPDKLVQQLREPGIHQGAIEQLASLGPAVLPRLLADKSGDKWYWANSVRVIRLIGFPGNAAAIPLLISVMDDANWPGFQDAEDELVSIGGAIVPHVITVMRAQASDDLWMTNLFTMLKCLPPQQLSELIPALGDFLDDQTRVDTYGDATVAAIELIEHIGAGAVMTIPAVVRLALDATQPRSVRVASLHALSQFDAESVKPLRGSLEGLLEDSDAEIRVSAQSLLDENKRGN